MFSDIFFSKVGFFFFNKFFFLMTSNKIQVSDFSGTFFLFIYNLISFSQILEFSVFNMFFFLTTQKKYFGTSFFYLYMFSDIFFSNFGIKSI